jgi:hypothetical protein
LLRPQIRQTLAQKELNLPPDERPFFYFVGDASVDLEGDVAEGAIATAIEKEEVDMFCEAVGTEVFTESTWLLLNEIFSIMLH